MLMNNTQCWCQTFSAGLIPVDFFSSFSDELSSSDELSFSDELSSSLLEASDEDDSCINMHGVQTKTVSFL